MLTDHYCLFSLQIPSISFNERSDNFLLDQHNKREMSYFVNNLLLLEIYESLQILSQTNPTTLKFRATNKGHLACKDMSLDKITSCAVA